MRGAWAWVIVLAASGAAHAQPAQLSVSAAAQVYSADPYRLGGLHQVEPDLGVSWLKAGVWGGHAGLDLNVTRRGDALRLGRVVLALKDTRAGGWTWDLSAGDTGTPPFVPDFGFSNLRAPTLTVAGGTISGTNGRTSVRMAAGRTTQTRNIFGTDLVELQQRLVQADASFAISPTLRVTGRASSVHNGDLGAYPTYVDRAEDVGAGVLATPAPFWQVAADIGVSRFRRRGAHDDDVSPSWLFGTTLSGARGRLEVNAQRFSAGRFAAANYPYNDRQGLFASGELQVATPLRVFGGTDVARTNVDPEAAARAALAMPAGVQTRSFGGVRLQLARRSIVTLRAEGGGREIAPSRFSPGFESDTGAITAEWHGDVPGATLFARYERRTNVDATYEPASFRQHEASGMMTFHAGGGRDVFVQGFMIRRANRAGGGETDWYASAGLQLPLSRLHTRLEGMLGRTDGWDDRRSTGRRTIVAGVSGQIARRLFLNADVVLTHAPLAIEGSRPWFLRSMIRVTRTLTYGTMPVAGPDGQLPATGPMGAVDSVVFVDWNGNGVRDPEDEPAPGVIVTIPHVGAVAAGRDGRATFARVPAGGRFVALDFSSVPADYDLPLETSREIEIGRGSRRTIEFGLIPVGSIAGMVVADADGDGELSEADHPIADAVVTLDQEARSELVREGRFAFANVRLGTHEVALAMDSLEEGAMLVGPSSVEVTLTKDSRTASVVFLVRPEKRPEIRRVFPPRKDGAR